MNASLILPRSQDYISNLGGILQIASSLVCDVLVSASLLFYFHRSRGGLRSTDVILTKLTMLTANTGLLTSIVCVVALAVYQSGGNSFKAFPSHFMQSKLHVNCLLASHLDSLRLNARAAIQATAPCESDEQTWALNDVDNSQNSGPSTSGATDTTI
ncbi:hypothetical protein HWV62_16740 [Athelia sp. TMB]|nr:hypothetical protein HWV62_16740 [Athelia sp. TMB]